MRQVVGRPGAAHDRVHLVALLEQQLREVRAILAGDPGDESAFYVMSVYQNWNFPSAVEVHANHHCELCNPGLLYRRPLLRLFTPTDSSIAPSGVACRCASVGV